VRSQPIPPIVTDAALLVVAFYFGVRSATPPGPVESPVPSWQPLFLPRGAVRAILLLGFFGVIAWIWIRDGALDSSLLLMGQVLVSYLAGFAISTVTARRGKAGKGPSVAVALFRHLLAAGAMGITIVVCGSLAFGQPALPPVSQNLLAWTVSFYFGSRLGP